MIRSPLGLRLDDTKRVRDQVREAAVAGAKGLVLDAAGELAPHRLGETGRRDLRQLLRSVELSLIAFVLPTRRAFDTLDDLDERLVRAERAFKMTFETGANLVLARVGPVPPETDAVRRDAWTTAVRELGRRAEHLGVRFAVEAGAEPGSDLKAALESLDVPTLCASVDPGDFMRHSLNPISSVRDLGALVAHAYASEWQPTAPSLENPLGFGFRPGVVDWVEYLGALEEVDYRGYLTIRVNPGRPVAPQFAALADKFKRF